MAPHIHPLDEELALTPVELGGRTVEIWQVQSMDTLLERMLAADPAVGDDDIPYYACLWPSARVLADAIARGPRLDGARAVELGCGVGMAGLAAALMGARVLLTDLQPAALALVRRNAEALGVADRVTTELVDWRTPGALTADLTLCSDVLYEARFVAPLASAIEQVMAPDGVTLLADPSRPYAARFLDEMRGRGMHVAPGPSTEVAEGGVVRLAAIRRRMEGRRAPWER